jgi:dTMP kinase
MKQSLFITVEGTDGSGKTTQIKLMENYLKTEGYEVVLTREPGGTVISEKIRSIILDTGNIEMDSITELLLYTSARAQLVAEVIKPALNSGKIVICDRFVDSAFVYQGYGRGINLKQIADVNRIALNGLSPDVTFFFDIKPEIALARRKATSQADRIESENIEFHKKVYEGYKRLAMLYPERITPIDSNREINEIFKDIEKCLSAFLG